MGVGTVLAAGFVVELFFILFYSGDPALRASMDPRAAALGTVEGMGGALFGRFVLPFEMTSVLLLVAVVGAVVLAKRKG
jgi:NADH-quinone oxidoreductase subunit J